VLDSTLTAKKLSIQTTFFFICGHFVGGIVVADCRC